MSDISTLCPGCGRPLDIPVELDNVICPRCAAAYRIRRHGDLINLSAIRPDNPYRAGTEDAASVVESRLEEIDDLIEGAETEIEGLRGREQSAPLQKGCAFFGLFILVMVVIAAFMLVGKDYVGSWLFYATLAAVIVVGLARIRQKLINADQIAELRRDRLDLEDGLRQLQAERERLQQLKTNLGSGDLED